MERLNTVLKVVSCNGNVKFPVLEKKSFLETSIDHLDLDTRSSNTLHRAKYKTIQDILDNLSYLPELKNCGTKSVNRILYKISAYYYSQLEEKEKKKYLMEIVKLNTKES